MKKYLLLILLLLLGSCQPKIQDDRLKVYTSFYPIYDLTLKIGKDKINLINLVPSGTEVHDWEISTKDMIGLESADLLIYNGLGIEYWLDDVVSALQNKNLVLVNTSKNVTPIEGDPHIWLNIENAILQLTEIKNALVNSDSKNQAFYEQNYNYYVNELTALHNNFHETIDALPKKDLVVAHEAFAYLCEEYGLNQIGVEDVNSDEPGLKKMEEIINFIKVNNVTTIFYEPLGSDSVAKTIASKTNIKVEVLNPLEGLTKEDIKNNEDYISIMLKNLKVIKEALK
jgi:zinc transport system substrate-binding protein